MQFSSPPRSLLHQLFVGVTVECTDVTDFATINNVASDFGFAHRALRCGRRLTKLQCELSRFLQLAQERGYSHLSASTPVGTYRTIRPHLIVRYWSNSGQDERGAKVKR